MAVPVSSRRHGHPRWPVVAAPTDARAARGALIIAVTLAPALGFVNVYPFKYSFVADHFQYLASVGIIALATATITLLVERWRPAAPSTVHAGVILTLALPLGLLTRQQSHRYSDATRLYLETLRRNPSSWLARITWPSSRAGIAHRPAGSVRAV